MRRVVWNEIERTGEKRKARNKERQKVDEKDVKNRKQTTFESLMDVHTHMHMWTYTHPPSSPFLSLMVIHERVRSAYIVEASNEYGEWHRRWISECILSHTYSLSALVRVLSLFLLLLWLLSKG